MSLEFSAVLYSGDNRSGTSMFSGVGRGGRYSPISADQLKNSGLYAHVESIDLNTTQEADGNLIMLKNDDYSGPFFQAIDARSAGDVWWDTWGHIGSVLLVAGNRQNTRETRVSFRDQFLNQWNE